MGTRPPMPEPTRRLIHAVFPVCVRCGADDQLQLAHIVEQPDIREGLRADGLPEGKLAEWHAAEWHDLGNVTRLCRSCEAGYNDDQFSATNLAQLRQEAADRAGAHPFLEFMRKELLGGASDHRGDAFAPLQALNQVSRAWSRGERLTPEVFILRRRSGHENFHHHVNVPNAEIRTHTTPLDRCDAATPTWEWWLCGPITPGDRP